MRCVVCTWYFDITRKNSYILKIFVLLFINPPLAHFMATWSADKYFGGIEQNMIQKEKIGQVMLKGLDYFL